MGCNNALLLRHSVRIEKSPFQFRPIKQIVKVTGLNQGTEGEITLRETNKLVSVPDGVRKLPTLGLELRLDRSNESILIEKFFRDWWEKRSSKNYTVLVDQITRSGKPIYTWKYQFCLFREFQVPDSDIASPNFAKFLMSFEPYDVLFDEAILRFF